jgi:hypothetical protein
MPWYVHAYLLGLIAIAVYSAYDDRRGGVANWYILVDAAVTAFWALCVVAYYHPGFVKPMGRLIALVAAPAVVWTIVDARREIRSAIAKRPEAYDPELSQSTNLWVDRLVEGAGVAIGVLLLTPALFFAFLVVRRAWQ